MEPFDPLWLRECRVQDLAKQLIVQMASNPEYVNTPDEKLAGYAFALAEKFDALFQDRYNKAKEQS